MLGSPGKSKGAKKTEKRGSLVNVREAIKEDHRFPDIKNLVI